MYFSSPGAGKCGKASYRICHIASFILHILSSRELRGLSLWLTHQSSDTSWTVWYNILQVIYVDGQQNGPCESKQGSHQEVLHINTFPPMRFHNGGRKRVFFEGSICPCKRPGGANNSHIRNKQASIDKIFPGKVAPLLNLMSHITRHRNFTSGREAEKK